MKVRVNFRSEVFLEGDTIKDIQEHKSYIVENISSEEGIGCIITLKEK